MPGNICISTGGETTYLRIEAKTYMSSSGQKLGNSTELFPNIFYEFGKVDFLTLTQKGYIDKTFQEYMFEFTANMDDANIKLLSGNSLYWPVVPEFVEGHRYQVSSLNGIVLFAEVSE